MIKWMWMYTPPLLPSHMGTPRPKPEWYPTPQAPTVAPMQGHISREYQMQPVPQVTSPVAPIPVMAAALGRTPPQIETATVRTARTLPVAMPVPSLQSTSRNPTPTKPQSIHTPVAVDSRRDMPYPTNTEAACRRLLRTYSDFHLWTNRDLTRARSEVFRTICTSHPSRIWTLHVQGTVRRVGLHPRLELVKLRIGTVGKRHSHALFLSIDNPVSPLSKELLAF